MTARNPNRMHRTARAIGLVAAGCWAVALGAGLVMGDAAAVSGEGITLSGLILFTILGLVIAWRNERAGGMIVIAGALALSVFAYVTAGHNKLLAVLVSGGPFLVSGVLFLASSRRRRDRGAQTRTRP